MGIAEKKYQLETAENQEFLKEIRERLLSFGHQFPSPGGSSYYLGDDGTPWKERNRETWITSRMAHVYSIGSMLGHEGSEALADAALKGLRGELHDDKNGGWYAGLTKDKLKNMYTDCGNNFRNTLWIISHFAIFILPYLKVFEQRGEFWLLWGFLLS